MMINIEIDENTLSLIKNHTEKDVTSIVAEALDKWTRENIFRCPIDEKFCFSKEPCNSCQKAKNYNKK